MFFDKRLSLLDKFVILKNTGIKILRGYSKKHFFRKATGLLIIGEKVTITHGYNIECGKNVKFEDESKIHGLCSKGLIFGNDVTIGRGTMIRPSSYYGKDLGEGLIVGNNSAIGSHSYIGCSGLIKIGDKVMFGPKCSLFAENHNFDSVESTIKEQGVNQKGIVIEDNCWIGSNTIILDGVTIGRGSVIAAGTIVTKDIPAYSLVIDKRDKIIKSRVISYN